MKREWKPGDVAHVEIRDRMDGDDATPSVYPRAFYSAYQQGWISAERGCLTSNEDRWDIQIRPLVVIDPEDREQVEALIDCYVDVMQEDDRNSSKRGAVLKMQAALRSLLDPPKPRSLLDRLKDRAPDGLIDPALAEQIVKEWLKDHAEAES